ncbi:HAMP domain-containing protein [Deinococcus sp. QL22]|uniref:HAMP domain-containing protein n=1 Tax=Deinococcus sp. QL22 TaxID=2939437 RepID=UPI002017CF64|nr:HAMP domain-containing protein [Deinococcus sp. QL22]UQN09246.1 HAMP domain-containing protein [Deinococcus sp. QL22]
MSLRAKIFLLVLLPLLVVSSLILTLIFVRQAEQYRALLVRSAAQSAAVFGTGIQELMDATGRPLNSAEVQENAQMRLLELVNLGVTPLYFATVYQPSGALVAAYDRSFSNTQTDTDIQGFSRLMSSGTDAIGIYAKKNTLFRATSTQLTPGAPVLTLADRETTLIGYPLPGGAGITVLGLDNSYVEERVRSNILPTVAVTLVMVLLAAVLAAMFANQLIQRIQRLSQQVNAISMGELSQPVRVEAKDELGDLAQSVERMRVSLETIMSRL